MGQRDWASYVGRPQTAGCDHPHTTSTTTAGLERIVCELCGHVSIRYQGETVRIWQGAPVPGSTPHESSESDKGPDLVVDLTTKPTVALRSCSECGSTAIYYTPTGLACSYHAWEAASAQEATGVEFWIPILIEKTR